MLALCVQSCSTSRKTSATTETRATTNQRSTAEGKVNFTNVTNERDSVVIAERDTLKEVTVITVDRNEAGDTVRVSSVTDRTRASSRDRVKDVKVKVIERTDTVYIEHKDSVEVKVANSSHQPPAINLLLKWIFAIICAIIGLIITMKVCLRRFL